MFSTDKLEYVLPLSLTNSPVQQTKQCSFKPNLFWSPMGQYSTRCYQQVADGRVQYLTKFQHRHGPLFISHLEGSSISKWFTKKKKIYIYTYIDWLLSSFVHMCITVVSSISQAVSHCFCLHLHSEPGFSKHMLMHVVPALFQFLHIRVISIPFPTNPSDTPAWLIYNPNTLVAGNCES